jgi:hypothetical protein
MIRFTSAVLSSIVLAALAGGCGAVDPDAPWSEEELGEVDEALGEAGCGTVACPTPGKCATVTLPKGGSAANTSPNNTYGSATCPNQYVVQAVTPPTTGTIHLSTLYGEAIAKADCPKARLESALYAKQNGVMKLVKTIRFSGVWNGSVCVLTSGETNPKIVASPAITEVRAAGRAYFTGTPTSHKRVRLGFNHAP